MDSNLFSIIPYKDHFIKLSNAVSAWAYYSESAVDLLSGEKKSYDFNEWIKNKEQCLLSSSEENCRVIHLFYELSFLIEKEYRLLNQESLLAIEIVYSCFDSIKKMENNPIQLKLLEQPDFDVYKRAFQEGYQELLKGNCYQFNLTYPYLYSFEAQLTPEDFIFSLWRNEHSRGAYGSATFIPFFNKLFLSNSPECLFQQGENTISSMPIKGTMKLGETDDWKELWKTLINDKKSQAELYMICDLIRNDLSRIEFPRARIVKKKHPKIVPGLLHQYSQIDVELSPSVSLWRVIEKVFPGGSITGAPKKRAMRIIHQLERRERGFYCGSTLILRGKMKSASINIRSSVVDFNQHTLSYQAGGGITLLSEVADEFKEMTYKRDSYIQTLTL